MIIVEKKVNLIEAVLRIAFFLKVFVHFLKRWLVQRWQEMRERERERERINDMQKASVWIKSGKLPYML